MAGIGTGLDELDRATALVHEHDLGEAQAWVAHGRVRALLVARDYPEAVRVLRDALDYCNDRGFELHGLYHLTYLAVAELRAMPLGIGCRLRAQRSPRAPRLDDADDSRAVGSCAAALPPRRPRPVVAARRG